MEDPLLDEHDARQGLLDEARELAEIVLQGRAGRGSDVSQEGALPARGPLGGRDERREEMRRRGAGPPSLTVVTTYGPGSFCPGSRRPSQRRRWRWRRPSNMAEICPFHCSRGARTHEMICAGAAAGGAETQRAEERKEAGASSPAPAPAADRVGGARDEKAPRAAVRRDGRK